MLPKRKQLLHNKLLPHVQQIQKMILILILENHEVLWMILNVKQKMDFVSLFIFIYKFYFFCFLDDIHQGVNRLKMLALNMNEELESQKPLTKRIGDKMEVLDKDV